MLEHRRLLGAAALAGAALALPAAPAAADSIVYLDGGNVHAAAPDGSRVVALTTDGTPDSPPYGADSPKGTLAGPWFSASADDQGRLLAARRYRSADGSDGGTSWIWRAPDGAMLAANQVSVPAWCGSAFSRPLGPAGGRIDPTGRWVAFMYFCGTETKTAVNFPDRQTTPFDDPPDWGFFDPTWFDGRLVANDTRRVVAQVPGEGAPLTDDWRATDVQAPDLAFGRTEYTRDGARAATLIATEGGGKLLALLRTTPPLAGGEAPSLQCFVPASGAVVSMSWSPDGSQLAWQDGEGVRVAAVPPRDAAPGDDGLCALQPRTLAATGTAPVFTAYSYGVTGGGSGPGSGGGSGPGTGDPGPVPPGPAEHEADRPEPAATRRPRVTFPRRVTPAQLCRGVTLRVLVPSAGRVTATARTGRTVVARGSAQARRHQRIRVILRTTSRARRTPIARGRLVLRVTFAPHVGAPATVQRTLRVE